MEHEYAARQSSGRMHGKDTSVKNEKEKGGMGGQGINRRGGRPSTDTDNLLLYLLGLRRGLPLQNLDELSGEPAFATLARPALPPLGLDLDPRVDFHARVRVQLSHHRHDLVLLQTELGRRRRLERVRRTCKRQLRRVERRQRLSVRHDDDPAAAGTTTTNTTNTTTASVAEALLLLELLLLLSRTLHEEFDEFVHGVGDAEEGDEEEHEWFFACVRRGLLGRARGGTLHGAAIEELAELAAHLACCCAAAGEEIAEPANEAEEAEDAAEGVAELGELVDDAGEGEEG